MPAQRPGVGARPLHFNFLDVFIGCSKSTFKDGGANYVVVHLPSFTTRLLSVLVERSSCSERIP